MRKAVALTGLLALGLLSTAALAAGWSDFEAAFPVAPCQDGWAGCIVDGKAITPDMTPKSGVPTPADLRVGWFDLKGTAAFSPFPGLSQYTGEAPPTLGDAVADAGEEYEGDEVIDDGPGDDGSGDDPIPADDPVPADDPIPADDPVDDGGSSNRGGDEGGGGSDTTTTSSSTTSGSSNRTGSTNRTGGSDDGTAALPDQNTGGGTPLSQIGKDPKPTDTVSSIIQKDPVVAPVAQGCSNVKLLEPKAMLGKLSADQAKCLEGELAKAGRQTEKNKISRVLMTNAWSSGNKKGWEKLVKRHLDEIDRSDPDICYKYALHLARKGTGSSYGVIRWSDVALENRTVWTGSTYTNRVNSLYKLKAAAAQKLWQSSENKYTEDASDANLTNRDKTRNMTKVYAREWYEYAKSAGKDSSSARALCISAAGTEDYCEGG